MQGGSYEGGRVMTPAKASAMAVTAALTLWLLIIAYNMGRWEAERIARKCEPQTMSYTVPFKGTFNDF